MERMTIPQIEQLAQLFHGRSEVNEEEGRLQEGRTKPSDLLQTTSDNFDAEQCNKQKSEEKRKESKQIWNDDHVEADPRSQPEYEMLYGQDVKTEDIFLASSEKHAGLYDHVMVQIKLPEAKSMEDLNVKTSNFSFECSTLVHHLELTFPWPVSEEKSSAKWDGQDHTLYVTIRKATLDNFNNYNFF